MKNKEFLLNFYTILKDRGTKKRAFIWIKSIVMITTLIILGAIFFILIQGNSIISSDSVIISNIDNTNVIMPTKAPRTCPAGFILVPGNTKFSTTDFCVAKYEMSWDGLSQTDGTGTGSSLWNTYSYLDNGDKGIVVSAQGNSPIAEITQLEAITECNAMGDGFHLITNNEWMTIARDIENQDINWSNGMKGDGYISNGISNDLTLGCIGNGSSNFPTENAYATITGSNICGGKNKHTLSNGEEIWDLSGNVREHVNKTNNISDIDGADGTVTELTSTDTWVEWTDTGINSIEKGNYGPSISTYNVTNGIGRVYDDGILNNIILRGAHAKNASNTGIFAMRLCCNSSHFSRMMGFRCAK